MSVVAEQMRRGIRQAGEAALMLSSAMEVAPTAPAPDWISPAVLAVYGERLTVNPLALREVVAELVVAHALALDAIAELTGMTSEGAAAWLVRLYEES